MTGVNNDHDKNPDKNPDPITGESGSHPVGTGIGSASGAATGAALGALGGPIGMAIGAIAGGITGGLIGHGIGEAVDPTEEEDYWRENFTGRDYVNEGDTFDDHRDSYAFGTHAANQSDQPFDKNEPVLAKAYTEHTTNQADGRGKAYRNWDDARPAVKDAYDRVHTKRTTATT
jgi:hypothetical protein